MNENKINLRSCAIVGCGNVGAATAYALMHSKLLSKMVLIDVNKKKAMGEAEDISHSLPFNAPMEIIAGDYEDISDCGIVIITAGVNQTPGQTRIDLLQKNAQIFRSIVDNIIKYNRDAVILVVTNPVDVLTYITLERSGLPSSQVIGSGTVLDTARLKEKVGKYLGVDSRNVHSFVIGEHGDSEVAVWSSANVSGIDLDSYCRERKMEFDRTALDRLSAEVMTSAYRIIEAKGATYYGIADSVRRIVSAIVNDEHTILPVSARLSGEYGVHDVCMGIPCIVGKNGIEQILEITLDEHERKRLLESASSLKDAIAQL
ncbi:MAG: L-lactate dehydrogenase [Clostridia bacterium]|nr:L-lactate dehydrogenase [Clostridia bacterium]